MKYLFLLILFVQSFSQERINIYPGPAPGTENRQDNERIENNGNNIFNVYQPDIRIFLTKYPDQNKPAVIICPGGGYTQIVIGKEGFKIAEWLNKNGIAAFVLKYRLNPEYALDDVQRAISLIRSESGTFNINKNNIGIIGFSAGGHLAANAGTHTNKRNIIDSIDPVSCRPDFLVLVYGALDILTDNVSNDTPPAFLVHAADDPRVSVNESINFYSALLAHNIPSELHIYEKGGHGFALEEDKGNVTSWADQCIDWLRCRGVISAKTTSENLPASD